MLFATESVLSNRSSPLLLWFFLILLILQLLFEHVEFAQEGVQCDVAATFVLEEVINEAFNIVIGDMLTLELVEELLEVLLRDVALTPLVN